MAKVVRTLKIKWDEDTLSEIYMLPHSAEMLGRYSNTGALYVSIPCKYCPYDNGNPCVCHNKPGVEGDAIEIYDDGKYSIKEGPKHLQKWLKAVGSK